MTKTLLAALILMAFASPVFAGDADTQTGETKKCDFKTSLYLATHSGVKKNVWVDTQGKVHTTPQSENTIGNH